MSLAGRLAVSAAALCALLPGPSAFAQADAAKGKTKQSPEDSSGLSQADEKLYKRMSRPRGGYGRVLLTSAFGRGIRFNNPYRLETQLGDDADSLSLTPSYFDLALGAAFGEPDGMQHGACLHLAIALDGVAQQAFSASYLLLHRAASPLLLYGRLGAALLTTPDSNLGGELATGLGYFLTGGLGATMELVGNLYYGAGTYEAEFTVIPTLSLQAGLIVDFEVLP